MKYQKGRKGREVERSPQNVEKDTGESGYGEMLFLDPNDVNFRRNQDMSPISEGMNASPAGRYAAGGNESPRNTIRINLENKKYQKISRSPKTINIGESEKDIEMNRKSVNQRNQDYYGGEQIALDQPSSSFVGDFDIQGSPNSKEVDRSGSRDYVTGNSRDIQYSFNPRDVDDPYQTHKLSPKNNEDDDSNGSIEGKGNDTSSQLKELKRQMKKNTQMQNDGDGMQESSKKNTKLRAKKGAEEPKVRDTLSKGEIKKIVKEVSQGYATDKKGGRLINASTTVMPLSNDSSTMFPDRYKVLQKMNKLSTILLSKKEEKHKEYGKKTFDKNTLNSAVARKDRKSTPKINPNKFVYLSLAMLSSKGKNTEDRVMLRKMRFEKGGVVDLAQEDTKKSKYKVKSVKRKIGTGGAKMNTNPKYREKAAKIIQGWWRDLKNKYQKILDKIILIQSVWRGKWLRKYIYDIIYLSFLHQRFCDSIQKVLVNHIRPEVWDKAFGKNKWIKAAMLKVLKNNNKFCSLRARPFYLKWKNKAKEMKKREIELKKLHRKKEIKEKNKKLLQRYFHDWLLRSNLDKFMEDNKKGSLQVKKYFGALKVVYAAQKNSKRTAFKSNIPKVELYLAKKMRAKTLKDTMDKMKKFFQGILRRNLYKWYSNSLKLNMSDELRVLASKNLYRFKSKLGSKMLARAYGIWKSKLPREKYEAFQGGAEILQRFTWRNTYKQPLAAMGRNQKLRSRNEGGRKLMRVRSTMEKFALKRYFDKWLNKAFRLAGKEGKQKLFKRLLGTLANKTKFRILSSRFNQWRRKPDLDLDALFNKYKSFCDLTKAHVKKQIKPDKENFLNRFKSTVHPNAKGRAARKLLQKYNLKGRANLRLYFYKWRNLVRNMDIKDLKGQLVKYLCGANDIKNNRNKLAKYLAKWRLINNTLKNHGDYLKKKDFLQFLDFLQRKYTGRQVDFWTRLNKKMGKDYRPHIIKKLREKILSPRTNLREAFNRWLNTKRDMDNKDIGDAFRRKVFGNGMKKINDRVNRDKLIKGFFKWKNLARNSDDYYPNIVKGLNKLRSSAVKKACKEPLERIKKTKRPEKVLKPVLRSKKRRQDVVDKNDLQRAFTNWKLKLLADKLLNNNQLIFRRALKNHLMGGDRMSMMRAFTHWRGIKPQPIGNNWEEGLKIVENFMKRPFRKPVVEAFRNELLKNKKWDILSKLFPDLDAVKQRNLRNYLYQWLRNCLKVDPNREDKLKNKLRKLIREKYGKPLERAFYKWIRQLAKNPDYRGVNDASDKLKSALKRVYCREPFDKINGHMSKNYLYRQLRNKLLPNAEKSRERCLRKYLNKWRDQVNDLKLRDLKTSLIAKVYGNTKGALRDRLLRQKFLQWANVEGPKPIDLILARQAINNIMHTLANYYFKDKLFPNLRALGKHNLFSKLMKAAPKYYARVLKHYLSKWRLINERINTEKAYKDMTGKVLHQGKKYRTKAKVQNVLRSKFHDWRDIVNELNKQRDKNIPNLVDKIRSAVYKTHGPELIDKLQNNALKDKKTKALRSGRKIREKHEGDNLKKYYDLWKQKVLQQIFKEMGNRMKYNQLRHIINLLTNGPLKAFVTWRLKAGVAYKKSPIEEGVKKLRKAYIKEPYQKFIKLCDYLNLDIPRGMSVERALLRNKRNIAKCIALRNLFERPAFDAIKEEAERQRDKAMRYRMFRQIMTPVFGDLDKLDLRRGFNTWRDKKNQLEYLDSLKPIRSRILLLLHARNTKNLMKTYFDDWRTSSEKFKQKAEKLRAGCDKLRNAANRNVTNQMREAIKKQNNMDRVKSIFRLCLNNNDRTNLANAFNKWRAAANADKLLDAKLLFINSLMNRNDFKNEEYCKNRLRESFLKWRINSFPRDVQEKMANIREGVELLHKGMRAPFNQEILDNVEEYGRKKYRIKLLEDIYNTLGPKFDQYQERRAIRIWEDKLGDTQRMKDKLEQLLNDYLMSEPVHEELIHQPEQDLVNAMNDRHDKKLRSAKPISKFCKGPEQVKNQVQRMKRTLLTNEIFKKTVAKLFGKYKTGFQKWKRNARFMKQEENAKKIQAFLRERLYNPTDKRKRIVMGGEFLEKYLKKLFMNQLKEKNRWVAMQRLCKKHIDDQDALNKKVLGDKFKRWRDIIPILRENEAATMIENNYLNLRARRKRDFLKERLEKLRNIFLNYLNQRKDTLSTGLHKWNDIAHKLKCIEKAQVLQAFFRERLAKVLKDQAEEKLREMVRRHMTKLLCDALRKTSRIWGDKGEVMYRTLEDIFIRAPFEKLVEGMKWIGRIKQLKKTIPDVQDALKAYFVPKALRKWKRNTWDDMMNKLMLLQRCTKKWLDLLHKNREQRKHDLLLRAVNRKTKAENLQQTVPFKNWNKKTKLAKFNDDVETIQNKFRAGKAKDKVKKLKAKKNLKDLFDKAVKNQVKNAMEDADTYATPLRNMLRKEHTGQMEERYATNDIVDFANDRLRNWFMNKLYGNKDLKDRLGALRKYFDRWRRNGEAMDQAATRLENAYRCRSARKKRSDLERLRELLEKYMFLKIFDDKEKLRSALKKWLNKAKTLAMIENGIIIERFLREKMARLYNMRFKKFFSNGPKLAGKRIQNVYKINKLLQALKRPSWNEFMKCYNIYMYITKLRKCMLRIFPTYDDQLRRRILDYNINLWNDKTKRWNQLEYDAATKIENNWRNYQARQKLAYLRALRDKMLRIILKLLNDNELKKQAAFNIWRNKTNLVKMNDNARIIQDFCGDIRDKIDNRLRARKKLGYKNLAKKLVNSRSCMRDPFEKIRSEANRNKFKRMVDILEQMKLDRERDGYEAIKLAAMRNLVLRLLQIPPAFKARIMKRALNQWHDKAMKTARKLSAEMIQKNWRLYLARQLNNNRLKNLLERLLALHAKWDDIKARYFHEWNDLAQKKKVLRAGRKINRFMEDKYQAHNINKDWKKMGDDLDIDNQKKELSAIRKRVFEDAGLKKIKPPIYLHAGKAGWEALMRRYRNLRIIDRMKLLCEKWNGKNDMYLKDLYLNRWNDKAQKLKRRAEALCDAMNLVDTRKKIIAADAVNSASLLKRFFNTYTKARKIDFINRLKENAEIKRKSENLGKALVKANDEITNDVKNVLAEKLYKIFTYRKLDKMYDILFNELKKRAFLAGNDFFKRLGENLLKESYFNTDSQKEQQAQCPTTKLRFRKKVTNPKNVPMTSDKLAPIKKVMPYFVDYLEGKIKDEKKYAYDKLMLNDRAGRFCALVKKYNARKQVPNKKDLVDALIGQTEYMDTKGLYILNLYKLLRKYWVHLVAEGIKPAVKVYRLAYILRLTAMNKLISKKRFMREIQRKWRFSAFVKKMAKKKLDLMYRNLQVSYLQMANDIFGDDENSVNPSVMKEFETFGDNMGMFQAEASGATESVKKRYTKGFQMKYQFHDDVNLEGERKGHRTVYKTIEQEQEDELNSKDLEDEEQ